MGTDGHGYLHFDGFTMNDHQRAHSCQTRRVPSVFLKQSRSVRREQLDRSTDPSAQEIPSNIAFENQP
jgi:hypothetical protein